MYRSGRKQGAKDVRPRKRRPSIPNDVRFWSHVKKTPECWVWTGATQLHGYGAFMWRLARNSYRKVLAHRVSAEMAGMSIVGMSVCHRCDNPRCVRPDHFFVGSRADNIRDMDAKGRRGSLKGSRHGMAKLTEFQVQEIRRLRAEGARGVDLAKRFNVCPSTIVWVTKGRHWTHVSS
jgi:hypothetical protein